MQSTSWIDLLKLLKQLVNLGSLFLHKGNENKNEIQRDKEWIYNRNDLWSFFKRKEMKKD